MVRKPPTQKGATDTDTELDAAICELDCRHFFRTQSPGRTRARCLMASQELEVLPQTCSHWDPWNQDELDTREARRGRAETRNHTEEPAE